MSFTYYTESRVVNLYIGDPPEILDFGIPYDATDVYSLRPMTKLITEEDEDLTSPNQYPYVFVKVAGGAVPEGAKEGGWILRKLIRKGLKVGIKSEKTGEVFTGVAYGDYKWNGDFRSNASMRYVNKGVACTKCGRRVSDHRVYETVNLRQRLTELINKHKIAQRASGVMVGMLEIFSKNGQSITLVADSGFAFPFKTTVSEVKDLVYVSSEMLDGKTFLACNGEAPVAKDERLRLPEKIDLRLKQKEIQCAAPKLLQAYIHFYRESSVEPILYLSEIFCGTQESPFARAVAIPYKPASKAATMKINVPVASGTTEITVTKPEGELPYPHLDTAESCNLCRGRIAQMLCGHSNIDKGDQKRLRTFS